jgi:hypothetical protein
MFTLFKSTPIVPKVKPVNLRFINSYWKKFEESLRNLDELQKEKNHL